MVIHHAGKKHINLKCPWRKKQLRSPHHSLHPNVFQLILWRSYRPSRTLIANHWCHSHLQLIKPSINLNSIIQHTPSIPSNKSFQILNISLQLNKTSRHPCLLGDGWEGGSSSSLISLAHLDRSKLSRPYLQGVLF